MNAKRIAIYLNRFAWIIALCAFIYAWFHAPFDNDPLQLEAVLIFMLCIAIAAVVWLITYPMRH